MQENIEKITKEMVATSEKLLKGYQMLSEIEDVDLATAEKELVFQVDKLRLFRYVSEKRTCKVPLLMVYALVNRFEMLDLQPDRSFVRNMLNAGIDVYVIDWGYPTKQDRYLTMHDYINGYIGDCVDYIRKTHKIPKVNLLGICQGGTFSTIFSALHPNKVQTLTTLVAPFDFDTEDGLLFKWSRSLDVDKVVDCNDGLVPGEFLNMGFDMLKPLSKVKKFNSLPDMMTDKAKLMNFLRMEKWVADSPSQAGECYRQFIKDLYQNNKLIKGELIIDGEKVNLKNITMPVLNIYASDDHLVPPSATKPLNEHVGTKDKELYEFPGGHIGVFVGNRSQKELAPKVANFIKDRA
ncbi:MAG: class III poly(R)-hydroxyalkanoic acid synthase subunit PhaC [Cytophagales bacterium]|nr:MAG: class III poly(R)-hydroxyalkanoic acid synthase subunit PhaC [Cytophagales bacterium]TAF60154.1 MAG: class III poly(R)-hydroxyalkanoic acid synthase subunit PhaC [Cytophagales bacterium]